MKLIVSEHINHVATPQKKVFSVTADAVGSYNTIPLSVGLAKGDIIVFRGEGDPVRLSSGNVDGRVLTVDSTSETGLAWAPGGSGSTSTVTLHNGTGSIVEGGTIVKISSGHELALATSEDTSMLFITAEDCQDDADVICYGTANTTCSVRCTSDAVAVGDELGVSSTNGVAETVQAYGFCKALTSKASGSTGTVEVLIIQAGFLPLTGGTVTGNVNVSGNVVAGELKPSTALSIAYGGTGATTAAAAWTALGGGSIGKKNGLAASDIPSISTDKITSGTLPVGRGGTGQTTLQATRNAMGLGDTTGALPIANGGTGKTTAAEAWTALGGGAIGKKASLAASDIPSISTDKLTSGTLPIARGGTGATTAAAAWTALGGGAIGKKASLAASDIPALSTDKLTSGTLPIARGGTGASSAATARQNLFNEDLKTSGTFLVAITDGWAKGGHIGKASVLSWAGATDIAKRPNYSISTTDLTAGTSALSSNQLYFVYS